MAAVWKSFWPEKMSPCAGERRLTWPVTSAEEWSICTTRTSTTEISTLRWDHQSCMIPISSAECSLLYLTHHQDWETETRKLSGWVKQSKVPYRFSFCFLLVALFSHNHTMILKYLEDCCNIFLMKWNVLVASVPRQAELQISKLA